MHKKSIPAATAIILLAILFLAGAAIIPKRNGGASPCPLQDELKPLLSGEAAGMRQWNAFREIYSFEVEGFQKKVEGYTIGFNQGYVNCVKDGQFCFKCDRRDPILTISSGDAVLEAHEVTVGQRDFMVVGEIMCTAAG